MPILYEVDRLREKSFSTRQVGSAPVTAGRSSTSGELPVQPGADHQVAMPPGIPDRRGCPTGIPACSVRERLGEWYGDGPIDLRYVDADPISRHGSRPTPSRCGCEPTGSCPTITSLHACLVTYACDMTLLDRRCCRSGVVAAAPGMRMASLDHAMWFHRPFRADEWLLYDQYAVSTARRGAGRRGDFRRRRTPRRRRRARRRLAGRSGGHDPPPTRRRDRRRRDCRRDRVRRRRRGRSGQPRRRPPLPCRPPPR